MRLNENVKIIGENVILVPYEKHHVPKYHDWMEDEEIRRWAASSLSNFINTSDSNLYVHQILVRNDHYCASEPLNVRKTVKSQVGLTRSVNRLTGSERLSLDEEYEMQRTWRADEDKLTFIILSKSMVDSGASE
ncbi:unnamed protein product, partial [Strongylus vulgaris]